MNDKQVKEISRSVHKRVIDGFTYMSDIEQFGEIEDWRFPTDYDNVTDDCDGFAIACRKLLKDAGVEETRLVICTTETGEWHLVCSANSYILDNRQRTIKTVRELHREGYRWHYISGLERGDFWHTITDIR